MPMLWTLRVARMRPRNRWRKIAGSWRPHAAATAYLPPGLAAYLPASPIQALNQQPRPRNHLSPAPALLHIVTTSSVSTLGRQDGVDVGHGAGVPYTESAPEPYRAASSEPTNVHSATLPNDRLDSPPLPPQHKPQHTHTGHASSLSGVAPTSVSVSSPASTSTPRPTSGLIPPTRASLFLSCSLSPALPEPTSGLVPSHPGAAATPPLTESPAPLSTVTKGTDTDASIPQPTPGLIPSHPGVSSPRHTLGAHPTPHAIPASASSPRADNAAAVDASTPSLASAASTGGDSGYAASTETEGPATPGSVSAPASWPTPPAYVGGAAAGAAGGGAGETRLEPLRAARYRRATSPPLPVTTAPTTLASRDPQSQYADDEGANGDDQLDSGSDADDKGDGEVGEAGEGRPKKSKKPKLIQRLKEKMHVGSASS
ncbi:hypothetical protein B0H14DRAFT_3461635 [Mycena olivaceomarginata]|nr:hypothetical protein B0H14DRAFT_3461635 [Mycena olivaceomarginata]